MKTARGLIIAALVGLTPAALSQEIHSSLCLGGCPFGSPASNDLIIRDIYILSSNDLTKFADWVAYKVTPATIGPTQNRVWKADPALAANETLETDDYDDANATIHTDRGHQAPLASFTGTTHWRETNFLSNITPQRSDLNQGAWVDLESAVRTLAQSANVSEVYVMTGPLYERAMAPLPKADEAHTVPSGYWKVVAVEQGQAIQVVAFIFEQETPRNDDFCDHRVSVDEAETRSGLELFHEFPAADQATLEGNVGVLGAGMGCGP